MPALDHDTHPALRWMWKWGQLSGEDRRAFVALVEKYENLKGDDPRAALDLLEAIPRTAGGMQSEFVAWYRAERAALGFPLNWTPSP